MQSKGGTLINYLYIQTLEVVFLDERSEKEAEKDEVVEPNTITLGIQLAVPSISSVYE